jgi:hypothetical protein
MKRTFCVVLLLLTGCTAVVDRPTNWLTRDGALADPEDYADCLNKARSPEQFVANRVPIYDLPKTDHLLLAICMEAHGYQMRGQGGEVSARRP